MPLAIAIHRRHTVSSDSAAPHRGLTRRTLASLRHGAILAEEPFFAPNRVSKGGRAPAFFWAPRRTLTTDMDTELQQLQQRIESRLRDQEPDVELLAIERPAAERLRIVIDRPDGVDIALCERVTG